MNKLQGESKAAGSRPHFRDAALEPGSEHPVRGHRAVGSRSILDGGPWDTPSTVPCLGRSSAQGLPLAAGCPGGPRTSPGWRARSSRSPGCRRSCARGCRCPPADCSSPGWRRAESSARVTPCCPEAHWVGEAQQGTEGGDGEREALAYSGCGRPQRVACSGAAQASHTCWHLKPTLPSRARCGQALRRGASQGTGIPAAHPPRVLPEPCHLSALPLNSASLIPLFLGS